MNNKNEKEVIITIPSGKVDNPFIYPGDLSETQLCNWLHGILNAIKNKSSSMEAIEELREQIDKLNLIEEVRKQTIAASVYPITQDPTPRPDNQDICHKYSGGYSR